MMKRTLLIIFGTLLFSAQLSSVAAEKQDKAAKRAAILMQKMKQDMESEKAALQTQFDQEKQSISKELDQAKSEQHSNSTKLQGQLRRNQQLQAEAQKASAEKTALSTQVQQLQTQLAEKTQRLEDVEQQLKMAKADLDVNDNQRKKLVGNIGAANQKLASCEEKNGRLYSYGNDLVSLYADANAYQRVMRAEPFFQLKRVELENILQDKRLQLIENKVDTIAKP
jgi:chromosome segregation ATPase